MGFRLKQQEQRGSEKQIKETVPPPPPRSLFQEQVHGREKDNINRGLFKVRSGGRGEQRPRKRLD
jgi:hypothetical protein